MRTRNKKFSNSSNRLCSQIMLHNVPKLQLRFDHVAELFRNQWTPSSSESKAMPSTEKRTVIVCEGKSRRPRALPSSPITRHHTHKHTCCFKGALSQASDALVLRQFTSFHRSRWTCRKYQLSHCTRKNRWTLGLVRKCRWPLYELSFQPYYKTPHAGIRAFFQPYTFATIDLVHWCVDTIYIIRRSHGNTKCHTARRKVDED